MEEEKNSNTQSCGQCCVKCQSKKYSAGGATGGGVYGLAFIGALIYFMQNATSFSTVVLGILKAIVWPAMVVYKLLVFLSA